VNEEQLFLTREEAEYSRFVSVLTSRAAAGTDIGNKANVLMSRLDAELSKPDECQISMTAEDKNILSVVFMVYELFRRCKYDVLADHFNVQARLLSKEVIADEAAKIDRSLFQWIKPYAEIMDSKRRVILSHYPIFCYKGQYRTTPEGYPLTYMLYGHVHDTHDEKLVNEFIRITRSTVVTSRNKPEGHPIPCNMINCFCMFSDYIPVTLDDWIRIDAGRRAKLNRQSN